MDRASILGDAIEYLKELLQKINDLNYELESTSSLTPTTTTLAVGGTTTTSFYPLTPTPIGLPSRIKEELFPTTIPSPTVQPARSCCTPFLCFSCCVSTNSRFTDLIGSDPSTRSLVSLTDRSLDSI
ncbi:hypothetical protein L2E82_06959 [Cichorium intybus]|uniref:Uncharacterized protein n=1 Tax=Cichorium intybus TaxID=13427 RepID=A0ACB9G3M0_CICIN|nr:hypothetical protein L2E82_06959 [Cichorium intybus]